MIIMIMILKLKSEKLDSSLPTIMLYTVHLFLDWEKDDQYNGSPPRPAPRGPRTPPGPPPPDDDEEEQVPVTGQKLFFGLFMDILTVVS